MSRLMGFLIFLILPSLFLSCEFLLLPPRLRENVYDEKAQIPNLLVVQKNDEVVQAGFPWRPPVEVDEDTEIVEEVRLIYRVGGPPVSRSQNLPPEAGGSKNFNREEGKYAYFWELDRFEPGDEVWFALYPKAGNRWYAPRYDMVKVAETVSYTYSTTVEPIFAVGVDTDAGNPIEINPPSPYHIENDSSTGESQFLILYFDMPVEKRCLLATFMDASPADADGADTLVVHPMWRKEFDWGNVWDAQNKADKSVGTPAPYTPAQIGNPSTVEITEVFNRANLLGTYALYVGTEPDLAPDANNVVDWADLYIDINY